MTVDISTASNYFLSQADEEAGDVISNLKLQKLLYYAQGFHLALFNAPLFEDEVQAWLHGPVVPNAYHLYKQHGSGAIPRPEGFDPRSLNEETRSLLDEVYNVYGQYSAWKLRNMTHVETPWVAAYAEGGGTPISHAAMREFFSPLTQ